MMNVEMDGLKSRSKNWMASALTEGHGDGG